MSTIEFTDEELKALNDVLTADLSDAHFRDPRTKVLYAAWDKIRLASMDAQSKLTKKEKNDG